MGRGAVGRGAVGRGATAKEGSARAKAHAASSARNVVEELEESKG